MEKVLIIIRGLPGSGKTTFASLLSRAICTADDWYTRNGVYKWDYRNIEEAHDWCERKCMRFMKKGIERVVVANICATEWSMQRYFDLAEEFGYKVFVIVMENRHGNTNIHGVPDATLLKMEKNFKIKLI